jgi:hypothetical protein
MIFQLGQEVSLLHEVGVFIVKSIEHHELVIQDEFGFEQRVAIKFVVPRKPIEAKVLVIKKEDQSRPKTTTGKIVQESVIDLHAEALDLPTTLQTHELLLAQLSAFKQFCNQQYQQRIPRFKVIHGAGEGRLKNEIGLLVNAKEGLQMHDAQWHHGQVGASYIELKLSKFEPF